MKGIYERNGRWRVKVYVGTDETGRRRYLHGHANTLPEAELVRAALLLEAADTTPAAADTFAGLVDRWLANARNLAPTTKDKYRWTADKYLIPHIGSMKVGRVRGRDLDRCYNQLGRLKPSSLRTVHQVAHRAFALAVRWRMISRNPADEVDPPAVPKRDATPADADHLAKLLANADVDMADFVALTAHLGTRRGETLGLQWRDVDVASRDVLVRRAVVQPVTGPPVVKEPKSRQPRRVPISEPMAERLAARRERMAERAGKCGLKLAASAFVFSAEADCSAPWLPNTTTHRFIDLRAKAGVPDHVRLHDLRHYVATTLITAGVDPSTVAHRLGHARSATTLNVYAAYVPAAGRAAADLL